MTLQIGDLVANINRMGRIGFIREAKGSELRQGPIQQLFDE